ncbi:MAG: CaiB/BaiF CoA-transferase family protein [Acidimicrobiaceae bacterium]|nr:CaiB/BaiF CoA-transferase family protein [Acidimicrobiaceae bacterium]
MLEGVTVLELGQVIAGTFGGTILADMGAEVIKVEPHRGDTARNPSIAPLRGESAIHLFMNRGKRSVVLDLKSDQGLELFYRLVETADVVIDNFRPGVMDRLGIDHDSLKARNPDIITATVTGFGETGPLRDKAAFDLVIQAYSGHMDYTGEPDGPPARVGTPLADLAGGIYACISILGALCGRELHGSGRHADVSMLDSLVSLLAYDGLDYLNSGRVATRQGTAHSHMVPWQAFTTRDGHVVVVARDEKFWRNLCEAIDRRDLIDDPRSRDNAARVANREFVVRELEAVFARMTSAELTELLDRYDIPSSPVNDMAAVLADDHVIARGMVRTYHHPTLGEVRYQPSPMKLSGWQQPDRHAPMLGEDTESVLSERLGLGGDEIAALAAEGAIGVLDPLPDR